MASSCSAATAMSRSTRSNAGTGTCAPPACSRVGCSSDGRSRMINLETPRKFETLVSQAHQVAVNVFRPNSRRYDTAEHEYPKELDMLAALIDGMTESGAMGGAGVGTVGGGGSGSDRSRNRNGSNMASLLGLIEL